MHAEELVDQVPTVRRNTTGAEAARIVAEYRLSGMVVADDDGVPIAVIPGSQIFGLVLPRWVQDDRKLAHAYDEKAADEMCAVLNETTVGELLDDEKLTAHEPPSVLPEDTLIEIASVMHEGHYPVILVRERDGTYRGVLTMSRVLAAIAARAGQDSDLIQRRLHEDIILRGQRERPGPGEPDGPSDPTRETP